MGLDFDLGKDPPHWQDGRWAQVSLCYRKAVASQSNCWGYAQSSDGGRWGRREFLVSVCVVSLVLVMVYGFKGVQGLRLYQDWYGVCDLQDLSLENSLGRVVFRICHG